ncbi:MAG TPA: hypothetical protein VJV79_12405 [Polyangiaceae bacterium]|nr:hypothetical protein [Polyangiaceae bacterium]
MSNYHRVVGRLAATGAVLGTLAVFAVGCSAEQGTGSDGQSIPGEGTTASTTRVLAELKASDGTEYSFLQVATGDVAIGVGSDQPVDLSSILSKTPSLSALYEKLSGKAAPAALVSADRELAAKGAQKELESQASKDGSVPQFDMGVRQTSPSTNDGVGRNTQLLTSGEFQNLYCPSGWDFLYCWPNTGGNPYVQRTSWYLEGAMSATNCYTRFRYRYYDDGNWYTLVDRIANPGSHWHYYQYGSTRSRRFEILSNDGCGVRYSAFGLL